MFLNFFSLASDSSTLPLFSQISDVLQRNPEPRLGFISQNSSEFLVQWVTNFITNPVGFAKAVRHTFPSDSDPSLLFFATVTFPSLFSHFRSLETIELANLFLLEILDVFSFRVASLFIATFLLTNVDFTSRLWSLYDELLRNIRPIQNPSDYFAIFLRSVKLCSQYFTKIHIELLQLTSKRYPDRFSELLADFFFRESFLEYHSKLKGNCDVHELVAFLDYISHSPNSPHFRRLFQAIIPTSFSHIPPHCELLSSPKKSPIVICARETLLIQAIAMGNPNLTTLKSNDKLSIPESVSTIFEVFSFDIIMPLTHHSPEKSLLFEKNDKIELLEDDSRWHQLLAISQNKRVSPFSLISSYSSSEPQRYVSLLQRAHNEMLENREKIERTLQIQKPVTLWRNLQPILAELLICVGQSFTTRAMMSLHPYESVPALSSSPVVASAHNCFASQRYAFQLGIDQIVIPEQQEQRRSHLERKLMLVHAPSNRSRSSSIKKNSSKIKRWANGAKNSLFKLLFVLKLIDGWSVDEKKLMNVKALVRNNLNRPKLLNERDEGIQPQKGFKYCRKIIEKADELENVRRSWSVLGFAEIAESFMKIYEGFYQNEKVTEFIRLLLCESKTDALFESFFWVTAFLDDHRTKREVEMSLLQQWLPENMIRPFVWFVDGFKGVLNELDPQIAIAMRECAVVEAITDY
jgi:hypothetical protein